MRNAFSAMTAAFAMSLAAASGLRAETDEQRRLCVYDVPAGRTLNVRAAPGLSARVVGRLAPDTCGLRLVGGCRGAWCLMAVGPTKGWIDTRFVGVYDLAPPEPATETAQPAPRGPAPARAADGGGKAEATPSVATSAVEARAGADARTSAATAAPGATSSAAAPPAGEPPLRAAMAASVTNPAEAASSRKAIARTESGRSARSATAVRRRPPTAPHRRMMVQSPAARCVIGVAAWDTLRLRNGPGVGHDAIGHIPPGACRVARVGGCVGAWCRVAWRGRVGWVNAFYLE
jgi:SH3-like domain-containing protein